MNYFESEIQNELDREISLLKKCKKYRASLNAFNGKALMRCFDSKKNFTRLYVHNEGDPTSRRLYCSKNKKAEIRGISELHFIDETIERLENNIKAMNLLLKKFRSTHPKDVADHLPPVYRDAKDTLPMFSDIPNAEEWLNEKKALKKAYIEKHGVYKPEQLTHRTTDGTFCRSKNEVSIYDFLLLGGFVFIYELPIVINGKIRLADFTILCDDGTIIIIEHLGMTDSHRYLTNQVAKIEDYIHDGWIPNVNLFLTFDDYYGNLNMEAIAWLITARVKKGS